MKWEGQRESANVEDMREQRSAGGPMLGGRGLGLGGIVIALVASWAFGINPMTVLGLLDNAPLPAGDASGHQTRPGPKPQDPGARFVATVLADTEDVWGSYFEHRQQRYEAPKLVLFKDHLPTGCGNGEAAMGPFYCPSDRKVYIDLNFYATLRERLGAPGDFAQAYVIAHEVGHHLQNLMGVTDKLEQARARVSPTIYSTLSVKLELQADCYAGVWTFHSQRGKDWLDQADIAEALNAAAKIGDDTLQRQAQGRVVPESFTHGSSAQRVSWFKRGLEQGELGACDTFRTKQL